MVSSNSVVMGNGAASCNDLGIGYLFDFAPVIQSILHIAVFVSQRQERDIDRRPVWIYVGKATGYQPIVAGSFFDDAGDIGFDTAIEISEFFPGDRGFKGISDNAVSDKMILVIGLSNKGVLP